VDATQAVNIGTRQRQSDQPGAPGDPNNSNTPPPQFDANGQPIQNAPGALPGQPAIPQPGIPGQFQPGANGFPGGAPPGQAFSGQPPFPGQPFPGMPGQAGGAPGQQPGQPGFPQAGGSPTAAGNLINQLLTTPRPGGLNGLGGVQQGAVVDANGNPIQNTNGFGPAAGNPLSSPSSPTGAGTPAPAAGQTIGGGIAGVASKREQDGIKIYKEQKSYHKWEFVYDITQDPARTGGTVPQAAPPPGTPIGGGTPGATPGAQPGAPLGTPNPNGAPPSFGNSSPTPPQTPVTPQ
jgi:hypothetical protein